VPLALGKTDESGSAWCWCPWLLSNGPRRRRCSLACLDTIAKDHNHVGKLSSPLCTIATLSSQDRRFSNINSFYVHKARKTMNLSSHFSIAETSRSETWQNSCTTCVWSGSSASCEYSHEWS
jgi:hypothetical protein